MKFSGKLGYAVTSEIPEGSGNWMPTIKEYQVYGDVLQSHIKGDDTYVSDHPYNVGIALANRIRVPRNRVFDEHSFDELRYVRWRNNLWKVTLIVEEYPHIILTLGGLYHAEEPTGTSGQT